MHEVSCESYILFFLLKCEVNIAVLIRRKARIRSTGQASKRNIKKIFLRRFPLSGLLSKACGSKNKIAMKSVHKKTGITKLCRFLANTLRVNKNCHEKFLKKSVVRSRLQAVGPATYVQNKHTQHM